MASVSLLGFVPIPSPMLLLSLERTIRSTNVPGVGPRGELVPKPLTRKNQTNRTTVLHELQSLSPFNFSYTEAASCGAFPAPRCSWPARKVVPSRTGRNTAALLELYLILHRFLMQRNDPVWVLTNTSLLAVYRHDQIAPSDVTVEIIVENATAVVSTLRARLKEARVHSSFRFEPGIANSWHVIPSRPEECDGILGRRFSIHVQPWQLHIHRRPLQTSADMATIVTMSALRNRCLCSINGLQLYCPQERAAAELLKQQFGALSTTFKEELSVVAEQLCLYRAAVPAL